MGKNIHVWVMMKYDSYSFKQCVKIHNSKKANSVSHHIFHSMPSKKARKLNIYDNKRNFLLRERNQFVFVMQFMLNSSSPNLFSNFFHLFFALISLLCRWIRKYPTPCSRFSCQHPSSRPCDLYCSCWFLQWYFRESQYHHVSFITVLITVIHPLILSFLTTVFLLFQSGTLRHYP